VWDIEEGVLLHSLESHTDGVDNLLLIGDCRLVSCSSDHSVKVWDIEVGVLLHSLEGHTAGVDNLLLIGDDRLASSCHNIFGSSDYAVKVWNFETGTLLHSLEGHTAGVNNLLLTGNDYLVSSCSSYSSDHTVKVWDIERGTLLHSLDGHISGIRFMAFLPMSGYLTTAEGPRLIVWQLDEGRQVAGFTADGPIESYAITPDDTIILGDGLGRVHFLKLVGPR
jgi:WD40 repeat protein